MVGFGLRIETGVERTTIVGIFDIIKQIPGTRQRYSPESR